MSTFRDCWEKIVEQLFASANFLWFFLAPTKPVLVRNNNVVTHPDRVLAHVLRFPGSVPRHMTVVRKHNHEHHEASFSSGYSGNTL